jgi:uncharacterized membrane protein YdjX (TVP38/TMEM64 family)
MNMEISFMGFVLLVIALTVGLALWYLSATTRGNDRRREDRETRYVARQPWDDADGRANR